MSHETAVAIEATKTRMPRMTRKMKRAEWVKWCASAMGPALGVVEVEVVKAAEVIVEAILKIELGNELDREVVEVEDVALSVTVTKPVAAEVTVTS